MDAWMAAGRRAWGTALLLACARRRRKPAVSSLHRPPTSMAKTTRRQRSPRTSSGYVRSFACLAARRAGEPGWRPCRPGSPVLVKGETRVVSTATFWYFFSCKICIKVFGTRALNILQENERFIGKVSVQDVCMVSWQFIVNFLIGGFRTNPV